MRLDTNIVHEIDKLMQTIGLILDPVPLTERIATTMLPIVRDRVHTQGKDANGNDIGTYTPEYLKRRQKPPYMRTGSPDIVLSLTRQMENDMKALPVEGGYGIGYSNELNYDKAIWNEQRYGKKILTALTPDEDEMVDAIAEEFVNELADAVS